MAPRMLRRRDALKLLGSAAAVTVLLTACGGGQAPAATSAPSNAQPATNNAPQPTTAKPTTAPASQPAAATPTAAPAAAAAGGPTPTPNPLASVPIKPGKKVVEWWFGWGGMTALNTFASLGKDFNTKHDD